MFATLYSSLLDWNEALPTTLIYLVIILFLCLIRKQQQQHETQTAFIANKLDQENTKPMPSPPTIPVLGHIHLLRDHKQNPWAGFNEIRKQFGNVVALKMGIHQMALVSSNESMREILLKKGDIFSNRPDFARHHIVFGGDKENSLALCNWSNTHRDRRKMCKRGIVPSRFSSRNQLLESITSRLVVDFIERTCKQDPVFSSEIHLDKSSTTNSTYNNTNNNNNETIATLNNHLSADNLNTNVSQQKTTDNLFYYKMNKENLLFLTSDIFMDFLCTESRPHSDSKYKEFVLGCDFVFWDINQCYLIDFLPYLTSFGVGFTHLRKLKRITDFLRDYIDDQIFDPRYKKHTKLGGTERPDDGQEEDIIKDHDYLDSIVAECIGKVTSMSLADYKVGFADLLAGHAAVANILIRLLGHLALDEKIQDMICDEVNKAKIQNLSHKPSLPVTEAAMQEALRIASSPIVPHVAREDTSIDEFYVPKGTTVLFNNYHLNLSETLWKDPLKFDPTRFLERCQDSFGEETFKLNIPKHFMPFSVGMRQCLGYKMVETTTIVAAASICRKFRIKANDEALVRRLLAPKGSVALNPDAECFDFKLYPREVYFDSNNLHLLLKDES